MGFFIYIYIYIYYLSLNWLSQEFMEFTPGILRAFVCLGCGERAGLQVEYIPFQCIPVLKT